VFRLRIPLELSDAAPAFRALGIAGGEAKPHAAAPPPNPAVVLAEQAPLLPAALAAELSGAVQVADYDQLIALVAHFPTERVVAAEALRALVEQYRYEDIARALRG
jgi:hypothetical protein